MLMHRRCDDVKLVTVLKQSASRREDSVMSVVTAEVYQEIRNIVPTERLSSCSHPHVFKSL